jgi:hypothetical protein
MELYLIMCQVWERINYILATGNSAEELWRGGGRGAAFVASQSLL